MRAEEKETTRKIRFRHLFLMLPNPPTVTRINDWSVSNVVLTVWPPRAVFMQPRRLELSHFLSIDQAHVYLLSHFKFFSPQDVS